MHATRTSFVGTAVLLALGCAGASDEAAREDDAILTNSLDNELTENGALPVSRTRESLPEPSLEGKRTVLPWQIDGGREGHRREVLAPDPADDPPAAAPPGDGTVLRMHTDMDKTSNRSLIFFRETGSSNAPYCTAFAISHRQLSGTWWTDFVTAARCVVGTSSTRPGFFDDAPRQAVYYPTQVYMWSNGNGDGNYQYHGVFTAYLGRHRNYSGDVYYSNGFLTMQHVDWPWRNNIHDTKQSSAASPLRQDMRLYGGGLDQNGNSAGFRESEIFRADGGGFTNPPWPWLHMFAFTTSGVRPCEYDWGGPAIAVSTSAAVGYLANYGTGSGTFSGCARPATSTRSPDYLWFTLLDSQLWWYEGLGVPKCTDKGSYFTCDGPMIE